MGTRGEAIDLACKLAATIQGWGKKKKKGEKGVRKKKRRKLRPQSPTKREERRGGFEERTL